MRIEGSIYGALPDGVAYVAIEAAEFEYARVQVPNLDKHVSFVRSNEEIECVTLLIEAEFLVWGDEVWSEEDDEYIGGLVTTSFDNDPPPMKAVIYDSGVVFLFRQDEEDDGVESLWHEIV